MATIFDVATYILEKQGTMTAMKLQKLVYYSQAWSLAWDDKPLFDDDFQAWANGPVCPKLFNTHKGVFSLERDFYTDKGDASNLLPNEKETIDSVLNYYGDKPPNWLSNLTHQELPWKEARAGTQPGYPSNKIITKDHIQQYYGGLR